MCVCLSPFWRKLLQVSDLGVTILHCGKFRLFNVLTFLRFNNHALGIGNWELGIGNWDLVEFSLSLCSLLFCSLLNFSLLHFCTFALLSLFAPFLAARSWFAVGFHCPSIVSQVSIMGHSARLCDFEILRLFEFLSFESHFVTEAESFVLTDEFVYSTVISFHCSIHAQHQNSIM